MLHAIETAEGRNEADLKECNILTVRACGSLLVGRQVMHMEWQQSKQLPFYITLKRDTILFSVDGQFHYHKLPGEQARDDIGVSLYWLVICILNHLNYL